MASPYARVGVAAILAGTLLFAGIVGELVVGHDSNFLEAVEVLLVGAGILALGFAIWELRKVAPSKRLINIGFWLSLVGVGFLILFAVIILIGVVLTGDLLEVFVLFGLGLLLLIVGHLMFAPGLRHIGVLGQAWVPPLVAAVRDRGHRRVCRPHSRHRLDRLRAGVGRVRSRATAGGPTRSEGLFRNGLTANPALTAEVGVPATSGARIGLASCHCRKWSGTKNPGLGGSA